MTQLDETHCPPPNSFCPEMDGAIAAFAVPPSGTRNLESNFMSDCAASAVPNRSAAI
jgi:hypothetical protein